MTEAERKKPLVIELDDAAPAKTGPAEAPPVPEPETIPESGDPEIGANGTGAGELP